MITLRGMTWDHERGYDPMVATSAVYSGRNPDVRIAWQKRSLQAFADRPIEAMAAEFDLLVIDHPHVGEVARSGSLVALDRMDRAAELSDLAHQTVGSSHRSYEYDGHQWALAIDAATPVASYRPDKLDRPPRTWSEVAALAQAGHVLLPVKPVDALMCFFNVAANRGFPVAASDRLIEPGQGREVLEALLAVTRHNPPEALAMNPIEAYEWMAIRDDRWYCPMAYGYSNYGRPGFREHLLRFADLPSHAGHGPRGSTLGGTGIAVSALSKHVEAAVDYAFWIAGAKCQRTLYFDAGGQPGNVVAWLDKRCNEAATSFFRDTLATLDQAWLRPRYPGYLRFQDEGGTIVNRCLAGEFSIDDALAKLDNAYRRSLK